MKKIAKEHIFVPVVFIAALFLCLAGTAGYFFIRNLTGASSTSGNPAIHKIQHVVIIMQENRSFDSYFGTFPGANGIPMQNGVPTVCITDPATGTCQKPYHDPNDKNTGGPHSQVNAVADIDGGKMDGFVAQDEAAGKTCLADDPTCVTANKIDVMGYHTDNEIPNYWSYAKNYVLQDNLFESNASWSLPSHLYMVSEWSAKCTKVGDPSSCINALQEPGKPPDFGNNLQNNLILNCRGGVTTASCQTALEAAGVTPDIAAQLHQLIQLNCQAAEQLSQCESILENSNIMPKSLKNKLINAANKLAPPIYAWTDLTYLLYKNNVSWGYYVFNGTEPDCEDDSAITCKPVPQNASTPGIWNPLLYFDTVKQDGQLGNIQPVTNFYKAAKDGTLPAVSWVEPTGTLGEHPPALISAGQAYVTGLIDSIMQGPDWDSTAIFLSWDDWGGFYDHVVPPTVDSNGYGLRVPGLVISAYAKTGYIDHQVLSHDAYVKFIEDDFLNGQRLDPKTDGRPDPRPDVRESAPQLGDLVNDFNFSQVPRKPVILPNGIVYGNGG